MQRKLVVSESLRRRIQLYVRFVPVPGKAMPGGLVAHAHPAEDSRLQCLWLNDGTLVLFHERIFAVWTKVSTVAVEIHCPRHHATLRQTQCVVDQDAQLGFVVGDPAREQLLSVAVDHHAMVVGFTCIYTCPELLHTLPFGWLSSRLKAWWATSPSCPYTAISFASLNEHHRGLSSPPGGRENLVCGHLGRRRDRLARSSPAISRMRGCSTGTRKWCFEHEDPTLSPAHPRRGDHTLPNQKPTKR